MFGIKFNLLNAVNEQFLNSRGETLNYILTEDIEFDKVFFHNDKNIILHSPQNKIVCAPYVLDNRGIGFSYIVQMHWGLDSETRFYENREMVKI